jgi:cytochrome b pre-mRNA-processing protein 3
MPELPRPAPPEFKGMMSRWFWPVPRQDRIASLYGMIVAQGRAPEFYELYGAPDTVTGHLEMVMLHAYVVLRRLRGETGRTRRLAQGLFDAFCQDMDDSMREMGVGDLAVPRKMRRIGQAFYERQAAYDRALAQPQNGALTALIRRNLFPAAAHAVGPERLATYIRATVAQLDCQVDFDRGALEFADPRQAFLLAPCAIQPRD